MGPLYGLRLGQNASLTLNNNFESQFCTSTKYVCFGLGQTLDLAAYQSVHPSIHTYAHTNILLKPHILDLKDSWNHKISIFLYNHNSFTKNHADEFIRKNQTRKLLWKRHVWNLLKNDLYGWMWCASAFAVLWCLMRCRHDELHGLTNYYRRDRTGL